MVNDSKKNTDDKEKTQRQVKQSNNSVQGSSSSSSNRGSSNQYNFDQQNMQNQRYVPPDTSNYNGATIGPVNYTEKTKSSQSVMDYRALLNDLQWKGPIQQTFEQYESARQQFQKHGIEKPMDQIIKVERNALWFMIFVKFIYIHFLQREKWIQEQQSEHQQQIIFQRTTPSQRMNQIHRQVMQLWSEWILKIFNVNQFTLEWSMEKGNLLEPIQNTNSWKQFTQQASQMVANPIFSGIKDIEERRSVSKQKLRKELRYQLKSMIPALHYKPIPKSTKKQAANLIEQIELLHAKLVPRTI